MKTISFLFVIFSFFNISAVHAEQLEGGAVEEGEGAVGAHEDRHRQERDDLAIWPTAREHFVVDRRQRHPAVLSSAPSPRIGREGSRPEASVPHGVEHIRTTHGDISICTTAPDAIVLRDTRTGTARPVSDDRSVGTPHHAYLFHTRPAAGRSAADEAAPRSPGRAAAAHAAGPDRVSTSAATSPDPVEPDVPPSDPDAPGTYVDHPTDDPPEPNEPA